jgi:hypothetical protein
VKAIAPIQNAPQAKLQRQFAAAKFIEALHAGLRIINIDESVLHSTDHRKRGWMREGKQNQVTSARKVTGINLIAALCSTGELLFTVNCGITNSHTFSFFLTKLCSHLDAADKHWRSTSVLVMDNAPYHRSAVTRRLMVELQLPVLFLGPYHFRVAPVEMAFNFVKSHNLNTQVSS